MIDFTRFAQTVNAAQLSGKLTATEANALRAQAVTIMRPGCPAKLRQALTHAINTKLGEAMVKPE